MPPFDPLTAAAALLQQIGLPPPSSVASIPGGRNNFVWLAVSGSRRFLLKRYFWSEQDPRDRLGQEWAFLGYLRQIGCACAPSPLARDPVARCALLEFLEGNPVEIATVTPCDVEAAADFFAAMNAGRHHAATLLPASEACFTLEEHLSTVASRVFRLQEITPSDESCERAKDLVSRRLTPLWRRIEDRIRSQNNLPLRDVLPIGQRCLSPSDFGFHNALRQPDGALRFFDFEYAGWDDPAKTIIDFCNQPDGLLPPHLACVFRDRAIEACEDPDLLSPRILLLEPLYQLKWACICLNNFLPGRSFEGAPPGRSPTAQLDRALSMANRAERLVFGCPLK